MMRLTHLSSYRLIATRALLPLIVSLVVFATTAAIGVIPGAPEAGKIIFEERCASCHGPKGLGDGPRAPFLSPQPASLITAGISVKSDKELLNVISNGKPRTAMPAWKDLLTEQQQRDVLAYIRKLIRFYPKPLTPGPPNGSNKRSHPH